jgi:hypothetical protein
MMITFTFYTLIVNKLINLFLKLITFEWENPLLVRDCIELYPYISLRRKGTTKH